MGWRFWVHFLVGARDFSLLENIQMGSNFYPVSYSVSIGALSPEVKQSGHEDDHSLHSASIISNAWSYSSAPPISLHGMHIYFSGYSKFHIYYTIIY
jgi:hypothetical protein